MRPKTLGGLRGGRGANGLKFEQGSWLGKKKKGQKKGGNE